MKPNPINSKGQRRCTGYGPNNQPEHWISPPYDHLFNRRLSKNRFVDGLHETCKACMKMKNKNSNPINNPRRYMTYPSDLNCLYRHIDPETKEVKYIGEGTINRAYEFTSRQMDHGTWFENLLRKGFKPTEIVKVKRYNLTKSKSTALETKLLSLYNKNNYNLFNKAKLK